MVMYDSLDTHLLLLSSCVRTGNLGASYLRFEFVYYFRRARQYGLGVLQSCAAPCHVHLLFNFGSPSNAVLNQHLALTSTQSETGVSCARKGWHAAAGAKV